MKKSLKFFLLPLIALISIIVACNKSDSTTVEEAVDEVLFSAQERGGMGRFGCYELVFPVTFTLPDSSTATVNSYDEMKQTLRAYFEANGTPGNGGHHHGNRPKIDFVFPISVISQDGEVITVADELELRALREACAGTFGNHGPQGHGQHGLSCFEIVFPITIQFPDSTTARGSRSAGAAPIGPYLASGQSRCPCTSDHRIPDLGENDRRRQCCDGQQPRGTA
jgi:hypothetical protein